MKCRFTGQLKLHSLLLRSSSSSSAPYTLKLFLNRDDLDFSSASDLPPTQTLHVSQSNEVQDIPLKRALWNTTQSVTLFFVDNYAVANSNTGRAREGLSGGDDDDENEEQTRFFFLGFKGQWMPLNREPVNVLYEAAANPGDHPAIVGTKGDPLSGAGMGAGGRAGDAGG